MDESAEYSNHPAAVEAASRTIMVEVVALMNRYFAAHGPVVNLSYSGFNSVLRSLMNFCYDFEHAGSGVPHKMEITLHDVLIVLREAQVCTEEEVQALVAPLIALFAHEKFRVDALSNAALDPVPYTHRSTPQRPTGAKGLEVPALVLSVLNVMDMDTWLAHRRGWNELRAVFQCLWFSASTDIGTKHAFKDAQNKEVERDILDIHRLLSVLVEAGHVSAPDALYIPSWVSTTPAITHQYVPRGALQSMSTEDTARTIEFLAQSKCAGVMGVVSIEDLLAMLDQELPVSMIRAAVIDQVPESQRKYGYLVTKKRDLSMNGARHKVLSRFPWKSA
jgi:hypothetical protein